MNSPNQNPITGNASDKTASANAPSSDKSKVNTVDNAAKAPADQKPASNDVPAPQDKAAQPAPADKATGTR